MTAAVLTDQPRPPRIRRAKPLSTSALEWSATFWFAVTLLGQWFFFYYLMAFYGPMTVSGNYEAMAPLRALGATGFVAGDNLGNATFVAHAFAAGIIAFGGLLQFVPQIRARFPAFHRWNGRLFLLTVVGLSLSGFYLVWVRRSAPSDLNGFSTTINGVLILTFAALAYWTALKRNIVVHRRWALRLYLVSNAQWFLRIGLFGYFILNMAAGRKPAMGDPFLTFWVFGCYLVPLAVAEIYLRANDRGAPAVRAAVAGGLAVVTLLMAVGILGFSAFSLRILSGAPLSLPG